MGGIPIDGEITFDGELLARAAEEFPVGVMLMTVEDEGVLRLALINRVGCEGSGLSPDAVGRRMDELFPELYATGITQVVLGIVDTGEAMDLGVLDVIDAQGEPGRFRAIIHPLSETLLLATYERLDNPVGLPTPSLNLFDDAVIECRLDGTIELWDSSAAQLYGKGVEETLGQPLVDMLSPGRPELLSDALALTRAAVHQQTVESRQVSATGEAIEVVMTFTPRRSHSGEVEGARIVVRDITASVRMQETLEFVLEASRVGFWDLDLTTGRATRSRTHDQLYGYDQPLPEWTLAVLLDLVHPDDRGWMGTRMAQGFDAWDNEEHFEFRVVWPDDSVHWIASQGRVVRRPDGTPTKLVGVSGDITARKMAEVEAAELKNKLANLVDSLGDAVISIDAQGVITSWNPAAERLLGWLEEEALGQDIAMVTPPDQQPAALGIRDTVARGQSATYETVRRRKDGSLVDIALTASPLTEGGAVVGATAILRNVSERRRMEAALRHEVLHDALTGLPNRVLIRDRLEHALEGSGRSGRPVTVLLLDLDNFKIVNDAAGHAQGDRLLVEVARRMQHCLRPADSLGRFGGDEFVVVCEGTDPSHALFVADRLHRALAEPIALDGRQVLVTASIGTASSPPLDADLLLRSADTAMYDAKRAGRARTRAFGPTMEAIAQARLELSQDLREVIGAGGLSLKYQPVVDLRTGELLGLEALVRWMHPTRGPVPASDLVGVAEEMGQIESLDSWVLGQACLDGAAMMASGLLSSSSRISVNIGAQHISSGRLAANVTAALEHATGFGLRQLGVEVTETAVMADLDTARRSLEELRELGVAIALDDFGTGYSSLTYLQQLPISVLKIDQSFIQRLTERAANVAVAASIVDLATAVGIDSVIAEGVETPQQLRLLQEMSCSAGQGWLWSPAVSVPELTDLLDTLPRRRFHLSDPSVVQA